MKNVVSINEWNDLDFILKYLSSLWYDYKRKILKSSDFWLGQNRERFFLVARNKKFGNLDYFDFPKINKNNKVNLDWIQKKVSKSYNVKNFDKYIDKFKSCASQNDVTYYNKNKKDLILWCLNGRNGVHIYKKGMGTLTSWQGCGGKSVIKNSKARYLTENECEALHWFPKNYTKFGIINGKKIVISKTQRYYQLWNTISVNVLEAIIKNLLLDINNK